MERTPPGSSAFLSGYKIHTYKTLTILFRYTCQTPINYRGTLDIQSLGNSNLQTVES